MTTVRQCGFSLIEVLVAFAILAIAVSTILALLATGLRNSTVAGEYGVALALAESKLAQLQVTESTRLVAASEEGEFDGRYRWRSEVRLAPESVSGVSGISWYVLAVHVDWQEPGRSRALDLSTLRLGRAP